MLDKGASQPWQETMKELTGSEQIDGSAVLEYFAPLQEWLKQQNEGQACGWPAPAPQAGPGTADDAAKKTDAAPDAGADAPGRSFPSCAPEAQGQENGRGTVRGRGVREGYG